MKDVHWGPLDYLVVDAPPGTSDEHISIAQFLRAGAPAAANGDASAPTPAAGGAAGGVARNAGGGFDTAVIVTTPQEVSIIDVRKEVSFCRKVGLAVLGVVENMAGLRLPAASPGLRFVLPGGEGGASGNGCEDDVTARVLAALAAALPPGAAERLEVRAEVFTPSGGGAAAMCRALGLDLLGRVPLDPGLGRAAEEGRSVFEAAKQQQGGGQAAQALPSVAALQSIVRRILAATDEGAGGGGGGGGGGTAAAHTVVAAMDTAA
jgi:Mrp family chromosome partitioning ATPase